MSRAEAFKDGLVSRLRAVIELRGKTVAALERELGRRRGYIGDALRGDKRLNLDTVLEVLTALDIDPGLFFHPDRGFPDRWYAEMEGGTRSAPGADEVAEASEPGRAQRVAQALGSRSPVMARDAGLLLSALVSVLEKEGCLSLADLSSAVERLESEAPTPR